MSEMFEFGESAKAITTPNWSVFRESSKAKVNSIFGNRSEETTAMQNNRPGRLSLFGEPKEEANVDFATAMQSNLPFLFGKPEANVDPMLPYGCGRPKVGPLKEGDELYDDLCRYSSIAIEKYNFDHNTKYKFGKYVEARMTLCAGINYYITFTAKEDGDESSTAFHAIVYYGIQKDIQVMSVMKKLDYKRRGYSRDISTISPSLSSTKIAAEETLTEKMSEMFVFGESAKAITNPNWSVFKESSKAKVNSIFGNRSEETTAMQSYRPGRLSLFGEPKEEANIDFASQTTAMQSNLPFLFGKPKEEANVDPMQPYCGGRFGKVRPLKEGDKRYD